MGGTIRLLNSGRAVVISVQAPRSSTVFQSVYSNELYGVKLCFAVEYRADDEGAKVSPIPGIGGVSTVFRIADFCV